MAAEIAIPTLLGGETSALSSSTKKQELLGVGSAPRFHYRTYGSPAVNKAIACSMGAEYLPEINMVKMQAA